MRISGDLEVGTIGANPGPVSNPAAPSGGVRESGLGREGDLEGIQEYPGTVYVSIPDPRA